jgi:hypothetical protein
MPILKMEAGYVSEMLETLPTSAWLRDPRADVTLAVNDHESLKLVITCCFMYI